jgi:DNA-binding HxlR family transcriptional regulator
MLIIYLHGNELFLLMMKKSYEDYRNCPVRSVLDRFGDKWSMLVLLLLGDTGKMRFNELSKAIPDVSQKMLTVTLRTLEADGYIYRTVYPEVPPRVEYEISSLGLSLLPHLRALTDWASENIDQIHKKRGS